MITSLFSFIALALSAYSFIIFVRILFSWFNLRNGNNGVPQNSIIRFLYSITDPYLNWFRRFKFTQLGMFDFSAILGIGVIYFLSSLCAQIAMTGTLSLSFIIKLVISTVWSLIGSLLFIFIIVLIVRIAFIQLNRYSQILQAMDGYLESVSRNFSNIFTKKFTSYKTNLIILTCGLLVIRIGVEQLLQILFRLF